MTTRALHAFDLRSVVLFTCLTVGGTSAVLAQNAQPQPPAPATAMQAITPSEVFMRSDLDRNGLLSRQEAENLPSVAQQFDEWDRDHNGQLSMEEFLLGAQKHEKTTR